MKYWPLWFATQSQSLPAPYRLELQNFYRQAPSEPAFYAIMAAAQEMPAVDAPNLSIVVGEDSPSRRVFARYPDVSEWLRLERTCVMDDGEQTFIHVEALH